MIDDDGVHIAFHLRVTMRQPISSSLYSNKNRNKKYTSQRLNNFWGTTTTVMSGYDIMLSKCHFSSTHDWDCHVVKIMRLLY